MGMSLSQKCVVVLLGVAIVGSAAYFARIAFRPPELERYRSIPWVEYVHPNVKKLKQAQILAREGKLNEARDTLVKALITAPKSPVTRELRDLLGDINTQSSSRKNLRLAKPNTPYSGATRFPPLRESSIPLLTRSFA
jgi:hypothetical protein